MKRALVTGASGFVGANLTRRLLRDGHDVHLLLRPGYRDWRLRDIEREVSIHTCDLEEAPALKNAMAGIRPNWVFHLAAHGAYSYETDVARMIAINLAATVALADSALASGAEAFVHAGSSSEYGYKDHAAREDEAIEPNSAYAVTKAAATHYCQFAARERGLNAVTLRLYSIFGPYEEPTRLIPTLITRGLEGSLPPLVSPSAAHDFVYVDDAVDAMVRAAKAMGPALRGKVLNVGSGRQVDLKSVVEIARRIMRIEAEPVWGTMTARPWDTHVWVGSTERMERELGWKACTGFETGLEQTVAWFRSLPPWMRGIYGLSGS